MNSANDPVMVDSDVRILEEAIRSAAAEFGAAEFARCLAELPAQDEQKVA